MGRLVGAKPYDKRRAMNPLTPRTAYRLTALACGAALIAWPAAARDSSLAMLGTLAKGTWTLHIRDGDAEKICVRSGREFIQLRHSEANCGLFVIADKPDEIDVQYTCRGTGYGRTTVRRESRDVVQVQSRGIADGAPFAIIAEARREGAC